MAHADLPPRTVADVIEELQKFDSSMQVVVAYDGRFAHNESFGFSEGEGRELYNWPKDQAKRKILILDI